jgi:hypothetical protein
MSWLPSKDKDERADGETGEAHDDPEHEAGGVVGSHFSSSIAAAQGSV